jgi:prepilin-type N-terminal cleavage/methylation domain-containing protein
MAPTRKGGYTLIEMMVVTVLLALFSAILVPSYINIRDGQQRRAFYTEVTDIAGTARELAITHNATMYLQADTTGGKLVIKQEVNDSQYQTADGGAGIGSTSSSNGTGIDTNPQSNIGTAATDRSGDTAITNLPLPPSTAFGNFQMKGQASDSSTWKLEFYADGTCGGGAVELIDKGVTKTLVVNGKGGAKLVDGNIPDTSQESWQAGDYVQRQQ